MLVRQFRYGTMIFLIATLGGCSLHDSMHKKVYDQLFHDNFMSGQIVRVEGDQAVVCIGTEDGTEAGMIFQAYEVNYEGAIEEGTDNYKISSVGKIEIGSLIDGHFARATIVEGNVKPNDIVKWSEHH